MKVCDNYYSVPYVTHENTAEERLIFVVGEELNAVLGYIYNNIIIFVNYVNACAVVEEFH